MSATTPATATTADSTSTGSGTGSGTAEARAASVASHRVTLGRVVRSEWIKQRSLRTTWIIVAAAMAVMVGLAAAAAAVSTGSVSSPDGGGGPAFDSSDPLTTVFTGANFAVLLVGVLGCLAGAREYGSRMIATTIAAVPRRWPVLLAKAVVLVAVVLPAMVVASFGAFVLGMAVLSAGGGETVALGDDGVLRAVLGMAGYLTAVGLLGLGLGVLLRTAASSIGALVGGVLILPGIAGALLPDSLDVVLQLLPTNAAAAFTAVTASGDEILGATAGMAVLAGWAVVALLAAGVGLLRRDV